MPPVCDSAVCDSDAEPDGETAVSPLPSNAELEDGRTEEVGTLSGNCATDVEDDGDLINADLPRKQSMDMTQQRKKLKLESRIAEREESSQMSRTDCADSSESESCAVDTNIIQSKVGSYHCKGKVQGEEAHHKRKKNDECGKMKKFKRNRIISSDSSDEDETVRGKQLYLWGFICTMDSTVVRYVFNISGTNSMLALLGGAHVTVENYKII